MSSMHSAPTPTRTLTPGCQREKNNNPFLGVRGRSHTTGHDNMAVGFQALKGYTTGNNNIGLGSNAGSNLTTGSNDMT